MHFLTDYEKTQLKAWHRQERDGRVRDRIKAVLLYDKQWSPQEIAEALLISDQAVRNHIEDYKTSNKLKPENGGSEEKLSREQSAQLESHLQNHTYLYVNVQPAYGWIKTGVRKEIPANTGRSRINLSGAIDVVTHTIVIQEDRTLNAESTIRFFQKSRKRIRACARSTYFATMRRIIGIRRSNNT